jgi:hypothetical protein
MNHLFSMSLLLLLAPQNQHLPDAFHQLPEQVREEATLVVTGTYGEGRSPCIFRPDGTRVWALESWFHITKVYRGEVRGKSIHIKSRRLPKTKYVSEKLEVGHKYLVLLRPSDESMKLIEAEEYIPFGHALRDEEIVTIVELK